MSLPVRIHLQGYVRSVLGTVTKLTEHDVGSSAVEINDSIIEMYKLFNNGSLGTVVIPKLRLNFARDDRPAMPQPWPVERVGHR